MISGDQKAIPKFYLTDQPNLEAHRIAFNERLTVFDTDVIGETEKLLNGIIPIDDDSLKKLKEKWQKSAEELTYNKDSSLDNHFERPIKVRARVMVPKSEFSQDFLVLHISDINQFSFQTSCSYWMTIEKETSEPNMTNSLTPCTS